MKQDSHLRNIFNSIDWIVTMGINFPMAGGYRNEEVEFLFSWKNTSSVNLVNFNL